MVDVFASFKTTDGQPCYKTYGLNSNRNDFMELKNIPQGNLVSLDLNGFGKDPSEAIDILSMHEPSQHKISNLVDAFYNKEDDLIVFCAAMGGGTGTSTVVKTLETYIEKHVNPQIDFVLNKMLEREKISQEQFNSLPLDQKNIARVRAMDTAYKLNRIKKVGIIATIPVRSDGPNTLEQVNKFTNYLWQLAKNPLKGIAFITFPDNQKFYDDWYKSKDVLKQKNYRDFANVQTAEVIHELNLGTNMGGTDVTFDPKDFRKVILEGEGCLNINRLSVNSSKITSSRDMYELLNTSFRGSLLHAPIVLQELDDEESQQLVHQKVFNVGLLSVTNDDLKDIGSSYLDEVKETISSNLYLNGSIFTGNVNLSKTAFQTVAYTFYKTLGLPERLSKGLVEELNQYREQKGSVQFKTDNIQEAAAISNDRNFDDIKEVSLNGSLGTGLSFLNPTTPTEITDEENNSKQSLGSASNDLSWLKDW
ncbi:cell division protein FtsZ [Viridibacillus arvi]|uniref:cell division protein FtsZ n=1 Tax=Viridibacillus arvi TaxID=263475 RepID=UPI0034CDF7B7